MKRSSRRTEIPAEPEVIAKILMDIEGLFKHYPFVSEVKREGSKLRVKISYRRILGGVTDEYLFTYKYNPREDVVTLFGEGKKTKLAIVFMLRPGFPNTIVKIDAFLDGAGGPGASRFLADLLKNTSQYLWLKAQDYLAGRLKLEEIKLPTPKAEEARREVVEEKPVAVKEVEKPPTPPQPSIETIEKPVEASEAIVEEKPSVEAVEKPMEASEEASVEAVESLEATEEKPPKPEAPQLEAIPIDASAIREYSLALDDVVLMANILLKARLLARAKSSQPHNIADILKSIAGRPELIECKYILISLRGKGVDGKIAIDTDKMAIVGAVLELDEEKYYEVDALSTLGAVSEDLDAKIWCLGEDVFRAG